MSDILDASQRRVFQASRLDCTRTDKRRRTYFRRCDASYCFFPINGQVSERRRQSSSARKERQPPCAILRGFLPGTRYRVPFRADCILSLFFISTELVTRVATNSAPLVSVVGRQSHSPEHSTVHQSVMPSVFDDIGHFRPFLASPSSADVGDVILNSFNFFTLSGLLLLQRLSSGYTADSDFPGASPAAQPQHSKCANHSERLKTAEKQTRRQCNSAALGLSTLQVP